MDMANTSCHQWQCVLTGPQQRLEYLFNTGCFSDILIECPGGFSYNLHSVVLAMCSPVFEAMLFGTLATFRTLATYHDSLCLKDDPEALKYVFAHCYGLNVQYDNIYVVLETFKIADKYIIKDLKNKCAVIIQNLITPENFKTIYEFTVRHGYNDLRHSCIKVLKENSNSSRATAVLMWFSINSPRDLLMPIFAIERLSFDTWRNPKSAKPFGDLITILKSKCCNELKEFAGQVSGDVIGYIPGPLRSTVTDPRDPSYAPVLKLSMQNGNAKEFIRALHERYFKYGPEDIGIHIIGEDIPTIADELLTTRNSDSDDEYPPERVTLFKLPCHNCYTYSDEYIPGRVTLYFSETDRHLEDIVHILQSLQPDCGKRHEFAFQFVNAYMFPSSKLTEFKFSLFGEYISYETVFLPSSGYMWTYSPYIEIKDEEMRGFEDIFHIKLLSTDNDIPGW